LLAFFSVSLHAQEIDKDILNEAILKANRGDLKSQLALGRMFYRTKDHEKSIEWFKKAAIQGDAEGQNWLGHAYYLGPNEYKDYEQAKKWYGKAAAQGNTEAKNYLKAIGERKNKSLQAVEVILFLLLLFPVWWLMVGHFFNFSPKPIGVILMVIFAGGVLGFMVAFSCNGGAGGSSQMSGSAWGCLLPYLLIYHALLVYLIFSKKRDTKYNNS